MQIPNEKTVQDTVNMSENIDKELNIPEMDLTNIQPNNLNTITEYLRNKILDE